MFLMKSDMYACLNCILCEMLWMFDDVFTPGHILFVRIEGVFLRPGGRKIKMKTFAWLFAWVQGNHQLCVMFSMSFVQDCAQVNLEIFFSVVLWQQDFISMRVVLEDQGRSGLWNISSSVESKEGTVQGDLNNLLRTLRHCLKTASSVTGFWSFSEYPKRSGILQLVH